MSNRRSPNKPQFITKTKENALQGRCQTRFKFLGFKQEKQGKSQSQQPSNIFVPKNLKLQEQFKRYENEKYEQELLQKAANKNASKYADANQMTTTQWSEQSLINSARGAAKRDSQPLNAKNCFGSQIVGYSKLNGVEEASVEHSEFESHRMLSKRGLGNTLNMRTGTQEILEEDKD